MSKLNFQSVGAGLPPMINEARAAAFIGITAKRLRRLGYERRGPRFIKIGRDHLFRREDLLDWIETGVR